MYTQPSTAATTVLLICAALAVAITPAFPARAEENARPAAAASEETVWTCSMHPQIRQPRQGRCPICGMDLIPVAPVGAGTGPREIELSSNAMLLAAVRTAPVERTLVSHELRLSGKITYDETRLAYCTTRIAGRLEKLYVDYTGVRVNVGDHLVSLYSPDLYVMQAQYLIALRNGTAPAAAGRNGLVLAGLTTQQVDRIEKTGEPELYVDFYSPLNGTVVRKEGVEGMYVEEGTRIYTIADLEYLWLILDAYESDLEWIRYGQTVEFAVDACPGEAFTGRVAFIAPILDEMTRTVNVRVNVPNKDGRLKPGFLANAHITSSIAADGRAMDASLAGKWICPMHPEIVKDGPAPCDICGMKIVTAESLGYAAPAAAAAEMPLVIPASAPLITGKRAVVYVAVPGGRGRFEGRDVVLGPRAGDYYTVHSGLREGEHVVVNGAFKIDSTMQIQAKPSMMSPSEAAQPAQPLQKVKTTADAPALFKEKLAAVVQASFGVQAALAGDDLASARAAAPAVATVLDSADMKLPGGDAHGAWMTEHAALKRAGEGIARAGDIGAARVAFKEMSDALVAAANRFGLAGTTAVFKAHCPMAFDGKGGDWLQAGPAVRNPYFGAQMLECGDIMPLYRP